jgi:hypothetical protein
MNYSENAKNVEVKWFNWIWEGLSGKIWNVEDDGTTCDILINNFDVFFTKKKLRPYFRILNLNGRSLIPIILENFTYSYSDYLLILSPY